MGRTEFGVSVVVQVLSSELNGYVLVVTTTAVDTSLGSHLLFDTS